MDVTELHIPLCLCKPQPLRAFVLHFLSLKKFKHTFSGGCRRLHGLHGLRQLSQRLGEITHIEHKSDNYTKRNAAFHRQYSAYNADGHIAEIPDEDHNGHH
ncbi:hypothetical protein D3C75_860620 [compost metagenome]